MALDGQLNQSQLETLYRELEREIKNKNPQAVYNYGIVKSHFGDAPKAIALLQLALDLGVAEARGALSRVLLKTWGLDQFDIIQIFAVTFNYVNDSIKVKYSIESAVCGLILN